MAEGISGLGDWADHRGLARGRRAAGEAPGRRASAHDGIDLKLVARSRTELRGNERKLDELKSDIFRI